MSNRAEPILAYGFDLGDQTELEDEIDGFEDLVEASDNLEDKEWPVTLVSHGHNEYRYWFLSIRGAHRNGGDWGSVLNVPAELPDSSRIESAKAWCETHHIKWQEPQWSAMASYG